VLNRSGSVSAGAAAEDLRISCGSIEAFHHIQLDLSDPRPFYHKKEQALRHGKACSALRLV
jgi:hypothetical protein